MVVRMKPIGAMVWALLVLVSTGCGGSGGEQPAQPPPPNPVPSISSLSPDNTTAGGAAFTLTVNGSNFISGSVVGWNGANRTTTLVSTTQLQAAIPASDIATAGPAQVTVFNPPPGGGPSNALSFTINPTCGDGTCGAGENCLSCPADCGPCPQVESMDACGDSITKAFNAQDQPLCLNTDQEQFNWSTGDTHGTNFCSAGDDGVFSHAEALECFKNADIIRADPNSARSGADMLGDFVSQATSIRNTLSVQPSPRYTTVMLGHNDICSGTVDKMQISCPAGADQDPNNHCWTTPDVFEREFRKGLDILITVDNLTIGVASIVRLSLLCNHGAKQSCTIFGPLSCQELWTGSVMIGSPICGSLLADCSEQRLTDAYLMAQAYREILSRVSAEYAAIPEGGTSPSVFVGGQPVGGATKAPGVTLAYSDATWAFKFSAEFLTCCDCFHPSLPAQDTLSRILFEGLTCSSTDICCQDTGDPLTDATCQQEDTSGTFYPGFFRTRR